MIISKKRQYQDTASIREPGRCRPEFCDEPVDQTSTDPKLGARRNHKFLSHFRLIGHETNRPPHALARVPNPRRRHIAIGKQWPQSQSRAGPQSSTVVYYLSATVYCIEIVDSLRAQSTI